MTSINRKL